MYIYTHIDICTCGDYLQPFFRPNPSANPFIDSNPFNQSLDYFTDNPTHPVESTWGISEMSSRRDFLRWATFGIGVRHSFT